MLLRIVKRTQGATFQLSSLASKKVQLEISRKPTRSIWVINKHPKAVTEIPSQPQGCPPLLLEVDVKLLLFLKAVRKRGGVVNSHVVCAAAKALIDTAGSETTKQQLSKIDFPHSWVQSIDKYMGPNRRMATTSRPPVPQGLYTNVETITFEKLMKRLRNMLYHQSLC